MLLVLTVLKIISPVFFLGIIGYFWEKTEIEYPIKFVTKLTMNIALPCLIFTSLMNTQIDSNVLSSIIFATLLSYLFLTIFCFLFVKLMKIDIHHFFTTNDFWKHWKPGITPSIFCIW